MRLALTLKVESALTPTCLVVGSAIISIKGATVTIPTIESRGSLIAFPVSLDEL